MFSYCVCYNQNHHLMEIRLSLNLEKDRSKLYIIQLQEIANYVGALKQYHLFREILQR